MPTPTLHFHVTGLVQGVWFRGWTVATARALGLVGWVRNMPDGSVSGQAQAPGDLTPGDLTPGETEAGRAVLEHFCLLLHQGPPSARVDHVDARYVDSPERFDAFNVRY